MARSDNLKRIFERQMAALEAVNDLRAPLWKEVAAELNSSESFLSRAATVGDLFQTGLSNFRTGRLKRVEAIKTYMDVLENLRADFEGRSADALWANADLHPSTPKLLMAWLGKSIRNQELLLRSDKHLGWMRGHTHQNDSSDVGKIQQALGDPAPSPLGTCSFPAYAFHDDRFWSQGISADDNAMSDPPHGRVGVNVFGDLAGGASAHSLVGADFTLPPGYTNITATVSIDWSFSGWTFVIGGAAGTGADLVLRIENPAGSVAVETTVPLYSLLSPVIWGNSAGGSGNSVLNSSISTPDASPRTIRVFAGLTAHAECAATFAAGCQTIAGATIPKICITAT